MTGLLKDIMDERADRAPVPSLDLDAIIQTGDRRVRRRRVVAGGGVAAVATAVIAVVAIGPGSFDLRGDKAEPVDTPPAPSEFLHQVPVYASGTEIHYGDRKVVSVAPHQLDSFVVTNAGFVFTTSDNAVFLADGDEVTQIGMLADTNYPQKVVAGYDGPYVGWVDGSSAVPTFVVYDTATRQEVVRTEDGSDPGGQLDDFTRSAMIAIDGATAYWHNSQGVIAYDISAGTSTVFQPRASVEWLNDVVGGVYATQTIEGEAIHVGTNPTARDPYFVRGLATLSPSATRVVIEHDDVEQVFDVASGDDVTPDHAGYPYVVFGQWIDDDTFTEFGLTQAELDNDPRDVSFDLLTCSVSAGGCNVTNEDIGETAPMLRPDGVSKH
jgi:hypothetical protein